MSVAAAAIVAAAFWGARARSPVRRRDPILPLSYVAEQGRWFRAEALLLGWAAGQVATIRDFRHAPYIIDGAEYLI